MAGRSSRPHSSFQLKGGVQTSHLVSSSTGSERFKLSAPITLSASTAQYLKPTIDPKLLEAANAHCTNKARLSRESDVSHGFLLGSRYNSGRTIDTNPLKMGGVCVSRSGTSPRSFFNPAHPHMARRAYSAPQARALSNTSVPHEVIIYDHTNQEPLCIHGTKYLPQEPRSHSSAAIPVKRSPQLSTHGVKRGKDGTRNASRASGEPTPPAHGCTSNEEVFDFVSNGGDRDSLASSSSSHTPSAGCLITRVDGKVLSSDNRSSSHDSSDSPPPMYQLSCSPTCINTIEEESYNNDSNFVEENADDLLSPEAQKLTSEILMAISKTSLNSEMAPRASLASSSSQELPKNLVPDSEVNAGTIDAIDLLGFSDLGVEGYGEDTEDSTHVLLVDMSRLMTAVEQSDM